LYDFTERYPNISPDLIGEFLNDPAMYQELSPIFGGTLLLNQALEKGWYVVIMTSRPEKTRGVTLRWLDKYSLSYDQIIFETNKGGLIGDMAAGNSKPMFLIDDAVHHLKNLSKGVVGVAWSQPWNTGFYPRATYDNVFMRVLKQTNEKDAWTSFWS
jgi:hypothetical protein